MMAANTPPAARTVRAQIQKRLMVARCAFAAAVPTVSSLPDESAACSSGPRGCVSMVMVEILAQRSRAVSVAAVVRPLRFKRREIDSKGVKIAQPAFDRLPHSGDEGGYSPPRTLRKPQHGYEVHGKRITLVFQVEFDPTVRIDRCASSRPAIPSCKRHRGVLEQENSADLSLDVTGDPEAFLVAADEKCRDRVIDDTGIERLKLSGDGCGPLGCGWGLVGRQHAGALAVLIDRSGRTLRRLPS